MQPIVLIATVVFALIPGISPATDQLTEDDLKRVAHSLASVASETSFFLSQWQQGRLSRSYVETHLEKLRDEIDDAQQALNAPATHGLQPKRRQTAELADALKHDLAALEPQLGDMNAVSRERESATRIRRGLAELEK